MSAKFAHHRNEHGEVVSMVRGWTVYYPAECNGRLADLAFVVSQHRSDFVHFDPKDGHAYGTPMPKDVARRCERMRAEFRLTHRHTAIAPSGRTVCTDCLRGADSLGELLDTQCLAEFHD